MSDKTLAELVENAAKVRKNLPVERKYIDEALSRIDAGQEEVDSYPLGGPSLKGVYEIAARIESESMDKN